jgi:transposase
VRTTEQAIGIGRRRRRTHSPLFKAEAVGECQQPGVSIAAIALARGLNASVLRRWVKEAEQSGIPIAIRSSASSLAVEGGQNFVPVPLPARPTDAAIRIKVRRRGGTVSIEWPASAAQECALLLRELMR